MVFPAISTRCTTTTLTLAERAPDLWACRGITFVLYLKKVKAITWLQYTQLIDQYQTDMEKTVMIGHKCTFPNTMNRLWSGHIFGSNLIDSLLTLQICTPRLQPSSQWADYYYGSNTLEQR